MAKQPDYSKAADVFRKSMEEALAHVDKVNADLAKAKEQAVDQEIAAKQELQRIQRDAEKISQEFINEHRKQYDERVRNDTLKEVIEKLLQAGRSSEEIKLWLEVSPEMIAHAQSFLKFEMLGDRMANVYYETSGPTGHIYFNWDGLILKFPFEFRREETLAMINVPDVGDWENQTSIPPDQRHLVLEFIAKRVIRDKAPDDEFEITDGVIRIFNKAKS